MKGFKALNQEMEAAKGDDMQFELGKKYTVDGEVVPCENGFHFCEEIGFLNNYYDIRSSRIFEVEASGDIVRHNDKYAAQSIRLVRELAKGEIKNYFEQNWQRLAAEKEWLVRKAVAEHGCGLDMLMYDEDYDVRAAVAEHLELSDGYGLDILLHDEDWHVREAVANRGYGLDVLINDEDWLVRKAVAEQGYGLDMLVHDEDATVRRAAEAMIERRKNADS